jgi:hypothetical protein
MVRYAHQFSFTPHTYDLTLFLMAHKGGLDDILHRSLWYNVLPSSKDEFKSCRSPILFPSDGCIQKHEYKTWIIWIPMVVNVAQRESVGIGDDGLLIWLWDPRIHLIGRLLQIWIMIIRVVTNDWYVSFLDCHERRCRDFFYMVGHIFFVNTQDRVQNWICRL